MWNHWTRSRDAAPGPVGARFAAAARTYGAESDLQRAVARRLADSILPQQQVGSVLEVGCGTGFLTELLASRYPGAVIYAVDIARPMMDVARERMGECGRIRWHEADARRFCPGKNFPLIVSSSALHWMTPVGDTVKRLAGMLEPGGSLVSALMVKGTLEELHAARAALFPAKTTPVILPEAEEMFRFIEAAGLSTQSSRLEVIRERCGSALALFRGLNRQGVTGVSGSGCRLLTRTELKELAAYYDRRFAAPDGGVFATYRILYVKARKQP